MVSLPVVPPLLVAVALSALLLAAAASERVDAALKRTARVAFGRFVDEGAIERQRLLQSAYVAETYGTYAATTYLYAVVLAVVGGFVVVHAFGPEGEVVGRSEYLPAGKLRDLTIRLDREVPEGTTVYVVPHLDTNGDREFDYAGGGVDRLYPPNREAVVAQVRLPADASHPEFSRRAQAT